MKKPKDWLFDTILDFLNRHYGDGKSSAALEKGVKIFVLQHKPGKLPECFAEKRIYIPLQAGRAINPCIDGTLSDDIGDNISKWNAHLNEMTGIYWVGRHYEETGNPPYVGFCHYRRFLEYDAAKLKPGALFASSLLLVRPVFDYFALANPAVTRSFRRFLQAVRKDGQLGQYADEIDRYGKQRLTYCCNMFITDRETFFRYFDFAEKCLRLCMRLMDEDDCAEAAKDNPRSFGYLMEYLTGYWIWREKRAGRIKVYNACRTVYL